MMFKAALAVAAAAPSVMATTFGGLHLYWGQWAGGDRLRDHCDNAGVESIGLSFVHQSPQYGNGWLGTNFAGHCGGATWVDPATGLTTNILISCTNIKEDVRYCKEKGKKIIMSIGGHCFGGSPCQYDLANLRAGRDFALQLHGVFGPYDPEWTGPRPLDNGPDDTFAVDGFDFDIEYKYPDQTPYIAMVDSLRSLNANYYITAAPQCPTSETYFQLAELIHGARFDALFIQFYNNPSCQASATINYDDWLDVLDRPDSKSKDAKLYIGLLASKAAGGEAEDNGYVGPAKVKSIVCALKGKRQFGGVSLWDATRGWLNPSDGKNFNEHAADALQYGCDPVPDPVTSTISASTSTPPASSTEASVSSEAPSSTEASSTEASSTEASSAEASSTEASSSIEASSTASEDVSSTVSSSDVASSTQSADPSSVVSSVEPSATDDDDTCDEEDDGDVSSTIASSVFASATESADVSSGVSSTEPSSTESADASSVVSSVEPSATDDDDTCDEDDDDVSSTIASSVFASATESADVSSVVSSDEPTASATESADVSSAVSSDEPTASASESADVSSAVPSDEPTASASESDVFQPSSTASADESAQPTGGASETNVYPVPTNTASEKLTTSTVYATTTRTITSCEPETPCTKGDVVTEVIPIYTTVCPVTEAGVPKPTITSVPENTISTVYTTKTYTVTACDADKPYCPTGQVTTEVTWYTTLCPVTSTDDLVKSTPTPGEGAEYPPPKQDEETTRTTVQTTKYLTVTVPAAEESTPAVVPPVYSAPVYSAPAYNTTVPTPPKESHVETTPEPSLPVAAGAGKVGAVSAAGIMAMAVAFLM